MPTTREVLLPDIGDFQDVPVIEVLVAPGDRVKVNDSLLTLESDKATMEIPSPYAGVVQAVRVAVGNRVSRGTPLLSLETSDELPAAVAVTPAPAEPAAPPLPGTPAPLPPPVPALTAVETSATRRRPHASPSVRRFARELGVDLAQVQGTGPKGRILNADVQEFVKRVMSRPVPTAPAGFMIPEAAPIDFSKFGEIETRPLSRIKKKAAVNLHRSWVSIPLVTQFDEADITELDSFRKSQSDKLGRQGVKLTLLAFLMKAAVVALKTHPEFNASLDPSGENLILKRYYHLGVAVDTSEGLVVPVVRHVDQKGLFQLAGELGEVSARTRDQKLSLSDLQGASFTISSLGGIGGTAFTPLVNPPEVAILGIARASMRPVYQGEQFVPRLILPLALSYDHRVVDGAAAARFTSTLREVLSDIRHMLL